MRFLCRLGLHKWTAWGKPEPGTLESLLLGRSTSVMVQEKKCLSCGIVELRAC